MATSWLSSVWSHPIGARIAFYPSLLYGLLKGTKDRRWYDRIDGKVVLGALPLHKVARQLVENENISAVITLNEEYETRFLCPTQKQWKQLGVEQLRIPTVDYNNSPSIDQIESALQFIDGIKDPTKSVYIHCKAGRSRSAVVCLCYVMKAYNVNKTDAIEFVKRKRPHIVLGSEHHKSILNFSERLKGFKNHV